ncbi:matrix Gla protein [Notechis scutatus]|uniref:Matrix Gla protein n=1 Tax=Notechis scutatus TaxID=8663 RepID=A0A6J1VZY0_9SAUR|nr:matrix Gla protein [Notechis scutatus]
MRTVIILALLAVLMVTTFCYASGPFLNRRYANIFMRPQPENRRNFFWQERIRERRKTTQELQREECEDYSPCERYAMRHGYVAAYKRFFGQRRGE